MPPQAGQPPQQPPQQTPSNAQDAPIIDRLRSAGSVLVTVSANPSIDQLAACIGLTLALNKIDKHATAVYSGKTPSTIEFLKPEETLEKNTDSLRDFIISLDKSKADKLRYKVEDNIVKIFITPYKTSITEKDFNFSQGDFNVDVVIALGVTKKSDLDRAIIAHGRILHDAAVVSMNTVPQGQNRIGSIEWVADEASSLCEMAADLVGDLDSSAIDNQIATALLTGIVVETDRFSNEKSRPHTMQIAGKLMESGASTQLITTKLDLPAKSDGKPDTKPGQDGVLEIEHTTGKEDKTPSAKPAVGQPEPPMDKESSARGQAKREEPNTNAGDLRVNEGPRFVSEPPRTGGQLTAIDIPESERYDPTTDPMSQFENSSIIERPKPDAAKKVGSTKDLSGKTLHDIEELVESPHSEQDNEQSGDSLTPQAGPAPPPPLDDARKAVEQVMGSDQDSEKPDAKMQFDPQKFEIEENDDADQKDSENKPPSSPPPPVPPPMSPPPS